MMQRKTERVIDPDNGASFTFEQYDYPFVLRYGVTTSATLSCELSGAPNAWIVSDDEVDITQYTVGVGVAALVWSHEDFALTTGAHYYRRLDFYQEPGQCDIIVQSVDWALLGQQEFPLGRGLATLWGGPTISYLVVEPQAPCPEESLTAQDIVGGVAGLTLASKIGLVLQGSYVWVGDSEYRLTLAYRFGPRS